MIGEEKSETDPNKFWDFISDVVNIFRKVRYKSFNLTGLIQICQKGIRLISKVSIHYFFYDNNLEDICCE